MAYREKTPAVYILASKRNGTIYTGVTSDLYIRMPQHKQGLIEGFTKKYHVHMLVYYEMHHLMPDAIRREKQLKKWNRAWKVRLVEQLNPEWRDLWLATGEILMNGVGGQELPRSPTRMPRRGWPMRTSWRPRTGRGSAWTSRPVTIT